MESRALKETSPPDKQVNYEEIVSRPDFKQLISAKKKFLVPLSLFFLVFYFTLPLLTSYTTVLNSPLIGPINGAWVFAFAQFIMTWALCMIYVSKANKFDQMSDDIIEDYTKQGDKSQ
ncbi:MAG TPA: DUF485 domain-containing protein [Chondromyces sp.]|nr:DUF485 domain-containing protein [Chondromyces sp.]